MKNEKMTANKMNKGAEIKIETGADNSPAEEMKNEKLKEKERKRLEQYGRTMVTRAEAHQIATYAANTEVQGFAEFIREPLRVNLIQAMAIIELLKDKGLIKDDAEFQTYLDKVAVKLMEESEADDKREEEGNKEE